MLSAVDSVGVAERSRRRLVRRKYRFKVSETELLFFTVAFLGTKLLLACGWFG